MNSWVIKNIKTNKYVNGTDYRRYPHVQFTSNEKALLYSNENEALFDMEGRGCGKFYKAVKVKIEEVKE